VPSLLRLRSAVIGGGHPILVQTRTALVRTATVVHHDNAFSYGEKLAHCILSGRLQLASYLSAMRNGHRKSLI
jgi:hypothetical protein